MASFHTHSIPIPYPFHTHFLSVSLNYSERGLFLVTFQPLNSEKPQGESSHSNSVHPITAHVTIPAASPGFFTVTSHTIVHCRTCHSFVMIVAIDQKPVPCDKRPPRFRLNFPVFRNFIVSLGTRLDLMPKINSAVRMTVSSGLTHSKIAKTMGEEIQKTERKSNEM